MILFSPYQSGEHRISSSHEQYHVPRHPHVTMFLTGILPWCWKPTAPSLGWKKLCQRELRDDNDLWATMLCILNRYIHCRKNVTVFSALYHKLMYIYTCHTCPQSTFWASLCFLKHQLKKKRFLKRKTCRIKWRLPGQATTVTTPKYLPTNNDFNSRPY